MYDCSGLSLEKKRVLFVFQAGEQQFFNIPDTLYNDLNLSYCICPSHGRSKETIIPRPPAQQASKCYDHVCRLSTPAYQMSTSTLALSVTALSAVFRQYNRMAFGSKTAVLRSTNTVWTLSRGVPLLVCHLKHWLVKSVNVV